MYFCDIKQRLFKLSRAKAHREGDGKAVFLFQYLHIIKENAIRIVLALEHNF